MNIQKELIEAFLTRLANRLDVYGEQYMDREGRVQYACRKPGLTNERFPYQPLTVEVVTRSLLGGPAVSVAAKDAEGYSKWLVFDSDRENGDLHKIKNVLAEMGLSFFCAGKRLSREGHCWVLFDAPIDARFVVRVAHEILAHAEVELADSGRPLVEFFPKPGKGYSQMRAPLTVTLKPEANKARAWIEGPEKNLVKQLEFIASCPVNSASAARAIGMRLFAFDQKVRKKDPKRLNVSRSHRGLVDILTVIPSSELQRVGKELATQCPACAAVGGDTHRDNLRIKASDGRVFTCVEGGPGYGHKQREILEAFGLLGRVG